MKKTSLLLAFLLTSIGSLFAQSDNEYKKHEHQIAINATNFIQTLISFNGSTFNNTPYNLQYKYLNWVKEDKMALGVRTGFGYTSTFSSTDQPMQQTKSTTDTKMTDYRVGVEYQQTLTKAWTFYAGLDFLYGKTSQITYSEFLGFGGVNTQTTDEYRERIGLGPVCGIQFNMGKRLALGTEISFYANTENRWRKSTFSSSPNNNQYFKTRNGTTFLRVPSFIYFIIRL